MEEKENIQSLKEIREKRESLVEERNQVQQFEEETIYQTKKDKLLFEQIAHDFKDDPKLNEVCSSYQTMVSQEERNRRNDLDEYYASLTKKQEELEEKESQLQHEIQEREA